jgi:hypothetical protein
VFVGLYGYLDLNFVVKWLKTGELFNLLLFYIFNESLVSVSVIEMQKRNADLIIQVQTGTLKNIINALFTDMKIVFM